jgi:hypothetical protein
MVNSRLFAPAASFYLASPFAFADWTQPTTAEFTAGLSGGWIVDLTCALNQDGTQFDLDDSDTDDSLSFCQVAGAEEPTFFNATIVYEAFRSFDELDDNTATTAFEWLAWPDIEYFAIARVGEEPGTAVSVGDRLKIARVMTDYPVDVYGAGENVRIQQNFLFQDTAELAWNYEVAA